LHITHSPEELEFAASVSSASFACAKLQTMAAHLNLI
jgi:precorrin-6B methylase 1